MSTDDAIEKLKLAFPGQPFALRWVERGTQHARGFGFCAQITSDYYLSDSDDLIYNHHPPFHYEGWGATPTEAVDDLIVKHLKALRENADHRKQSLLESEENWRRMVAVLEGNKSDG